MSVAAGQQGAPVELSCLKLPESPLQTCSPELFPGPGPPLTGSVWASGTVGVLSRSHRTHEAPAATGLTCSSNVTLNQTEEREEPLQREVRVQNRSGLDLSDCVKRASTDLTKVKDTKTAVKLTRLITFYKVLRFVLVCVHFIKADALCDKNVVCFMSRKH